MQLYIYCVSLMFGVFPKGLTAQVLTHQTVMAAAGQEAHFSCQLRESKDVVQVIWQKVLPNRDKNMVTYTVYYGERVYRDFSDKVKFKDAGLQNSSIVMRNVTDEDEGCYLCLFNTFSDGALKGETCLHLCELHEPVLHVRESNSTDESLVSCSVTARPVPMVTLTVTGQHLYFSHYSTVTVTNTDATVTVTKTAVLSGFRGDSTQVGCAGRVPSGPQKQVFVNITEVKQTPADGLVRKNTSACPQHKYFMSFGCLAAVIIVLLILRHKNSLSHKRKKTPQTTAEDVQMCLIKMENSRNMTQTIAEDNQQHNSPDSSVTENRPEDVVANEPRV